MHEVEMSSAASLRLLLSPDLPPLVLRYRIQINVGRVLRGARVVRMRRDITALQIKPSEGVLKVGTAVQLNLFALNKSGGTILVPGMTATWSSSESRVGEINSQGRLTPRAPGAVTITATYADQKGLAAFTVAAD
jgi:hypothetical protein